MKPRVSLGTQVPRASRTTRVDVCLVAGGTGGHVYPAVAVAQALAEERPDLAIAFIVDARPASSDSVRRAGAEPYVLPLHRGLQRSAAWREVVANVRVAADLVRAFARSWSWLRAQKPRVVVGFGAYATVPVILAARARRIPVVVHEQNAAPGLANRLAVRLGALAAVSVADTPLRHATITGNPVRSEIANVSASAPPTPAASPLVAIVGASLGSACLNDVGLGLYDRWRSRADRAVRLVSGRDHYEACAARLAALRAPSDVLDFELVDYEHDMARLYASATVMVTRAGGSVWELAAAGMPAVIVPWAGAAGDHQSANARAWAAAGAAVHVAERDCTVDRVAAELDALLADPARLARMRVAAHGLARPDAAREVALMIAATVGETAHPRAA